MARFSVYIMGLAYIAAGVNHFWQHDFYLRMMPPYIPAHHFMVFFSGAIEIVLGAGVLFSSTRKIACYGIIALLLAVLPAHFYMLMNSALFHFPMWGLVLRLPIQVLLIYWAWRVSRV